MRNVIFIISSLLIFATFNLSIWHKEKIKLNGETILLELAPVDPRSLIQGDYMELRYDIEREATKVLKDDAKIKRGYLVISADLNNVARFVRFHSGEVLANSEKLLRFHSNRYEQIRIVPDSFMFQEGHAKHYQRAKYGIFKFASSGNCILVGLADDRFQPIQPDA